jgi:two-component sensor histidine kinase
VSLTAAGCEEVVFRLSHNGIVKQYNSTPKETGFGTELVNLLVRQLEGALTVDASNGTTIIIHFKNRKLY